MTKKILVLMSAFNGQSFIESQIESIMKQETSYEVVLRIRDDGSSDNTQNIVKQLQNKYPNRIEYFYSENIGSNAGFLFLLREASGYDYYAISDQDDVWLPNKLSVACKYLEAENDSMPLLYASTSYLVADDLKPYGKTRKKTRDFSIFNTIIQNICPGHTQVLNNKLLELLKGDIDISRIYVYDSWITSTAILYGKILFNNDSYTYYRQHDKNLLGYGKGFFGRLLASLKHAKTGDGLIYRKQGEYFFRNNFKKINELGFDSELNKFFGAKTFLQKIIYLLNSKLYRQNKIETLAFYLAVLLGRF